MGEYSWRPNATNVTPEVQTDVKFEMVMYLDDVILNQNDARSTSSLVPTVPTRIIDKQSFLFFRHMDP